MMWYKIFLLTSNGYLCCINISMLAPNFIISSYKKDFACKEREIIKRMINVEDCMSIKENKNNKVQNCDNEDNHFNSNEHININKNNNLFNYLYKCERKNTNESIQKGTTFLNDLDIFIYFNDLEFINYDQKHDIFNFRSYYHPVINIYLIIFAATAYAYVHITGYLCVIYYLLISFLIFLLFFFHRILNP